MSEVEVGQVWRNRSVSRRTVKITHVTQDHQNHYDPTMMIPGYVNVDRNTSRRKQPIKLSTLRREYVLDQEATKRRSDA